MFFHGDGKFLPRGVSIQVVRLLQVPMLLGRRYDARQRREDGRRRDGNLIGFDGSDELGCAVIADRFGSLD